MAKLYFPARVWTGTAAGLVMAALLVACAPGAGGQGVLPKGLFASKKKSAPGSSAQVRSTVPPAYSIAGEPLGFSPPAAFYLGMRTSLMSLDFLDEDRLLFTFRVPGLIHRTTRNEETENQRKVRAVVLKLPQGTVDAEAVWTLHDRGRYLYNLGNGQFLLRDLDAIQIGDAALQLKPFLQFPGPVEWVEMDPSRHYLVTGSTEPPTQASRPEKAPSPSRGTVDVFSDAPSPGEKPDLVLRIVRREDGKVMLVSHVHSAVHLPINGEGYLELLRGTGMAWTLNFDYFSGGSGVVGKLDSACLPTLDFISASEILGTTCSSDGDPRLVAMGLNGKRLWQNASLGAAVWPLLVTNATGSRFARESLMANHAMNTIAPLEPEDIKGQDVQVVDAATGKVVLRAAASPIFDIGGNVAISPSGQRVAIMMDGNLQMFELPAPPPVPEMGIQH
ncbi:MAG TPA: hypothetical protein VGL22_09835 [Terracidiphilus sp.]